MKIIPELEQGTDEWLRWRERGIGASEVGTMLGDNPYETAEDLWATKCGLKPPKVTTAAMLRGHRLEPAIRQVYETEISHSLRTPLCAEHDDLPWLRASLDGIDQDHVEILEIKAASSLGVWRENSFGLVTYYYWQCQQQLLVTGAERADLFCWMPDKDPGPPLLFHILPDYDAQRRIVQQSVAFMQALKTRTPPRVVASGFGTSNMQVPQTQLPNRNWWELLQQYLPAPGHNPEEIEGW